MPSPSSHIPRVVIVGAGFGGLNLARALRKAPVDVLLIDRQNYHTFQPLLYQVATAGLEPEEIAHAVRGIFHKQRNFSFRMGGVVQVDFQARRVLLDDGAAVPYDYLVLAAGADTNYFGVEGAEAHGFPLKSLPDAINLRSHIIQLFERVNERPALIEEGALTMVVVGGGPTGVEMAGALCELTRMVLAKDFPTLSMDRVSILLVEAVDQLLGPFHASSQDHALRALESRGVRVMLGRQVVRVTEEAVHLENGDAIPTRTLVWAAGVRANRLADALGLEQTRGGRIAVAPDLSVAAHPDVFVIGDLAGSSDEEGNLHPQLAPVAIQGADHVARQIERRLSGKPGEPFAYVDRGIMATIGRNSAVAELWGGFRTRGMLAWFIWLILHLMLLVGFRNKLQVFINWAWNYLTYDRSARLIMPALDVAAPSYRAQAAELDAKDDALPTPGSLRHEASPTETLH